MRHEMCVTEKVKFISFSLTHWMWIQTIKYMLHIHLLFLLLIQLSTDILKYIYFLHLQMFIYLHYIIY